MASYISGIVTIVPAAGSNRAPAATNGGPSTRWWPHVHSHGSAPVLEMRSSTRSWARSATSVSRRSSRKGTVWQSIVQTSESGPSASTCHGIAATSPW